MYPPPPLQVRTLKNFQRLAGTRMRTRTASQAGRGVCGGLDTGGMPATPCPGAGPGSPPATTPCSAGYGSAYSGEALACMSEGVEGPGAPGEEGANIDEDYFYQEMAAHA